MRQRDERIPKAIVSVLVCDGIGSLHTSGRRTSLDECNQRHATPATNSELLPMVLHRPGWYRPRCQIARCAYRICTRRYIISPFRVHAQRTTQYSSTFWRMTLRSMLRKVSPCLEVLLACARAGALAHCLWAIVRFLRRCLMGRQPGASYPIGEGNMGGKQASWFCGNNLRRASQMASRRACDVCGDALS